MEKDRPVDVYEVQLFCDKCGGLMKLLDPLAGVGTHSFGYRYRCEQCDVWICGLHQAPTLITKQMYFVYIYWSIFLHVYIIKSFLKLSKTVFKKKLFSLAEEQFIIFCFPDQKALVKSTEVPPSYLPEGSQCCMI